MEYESWIIISFQIGADDMWHLLREWEVSLGFCITHLTHTKKTLRTMTHWWGLLETLVSKFPNSTDSANNG